MMFPRLLSSGIAKAAHAPLLVGGLLAMVVLYHFLGVIGFWLALAGYIGLSVLIAYLGRQRDDRQRIREMYDRDELP